MFGSPPRPNRNADSDAPSDGIAIEQALISHRRAQSGAGSKDRPYWGLALSGGGIRSATVSLGVLQGLAKIDPGSTMPRSDPAAGGVALPRFRWPLLSLFDYLSTVSGGGYIGAFFCSLFVPGRLRPLGTAEVAADDAYTTMATVPPHRLRSHDTLDTDGIGHCPTAWLRENGRYLAPTGAGDYLYASAIGIRNWLAVQYVIGTLFLITFSGLGLIRGYIAREWHHFGMPFTCPVRMIARLSWLSVPWCLLWALLAVC